MSCRSNEIPKLINLYKNGKNVQIFISMITNLPGAPGYKWDPRTINTSTAIGYDKCLVRFYFSVEKVHLYHQL